MIVEVADGVDVELGEALELVVGGGVVDGALVSGIGVVRTGALPGAEAGTVDVAGDGEAQAVATITTTANSRVRPGACWIAPLPGLAAGRAGCKVGVSPLLVPEWRGR